MSSSHWLLGLLFGAIAVQILAVVGSRRLATAREADEETDVNLTDSVVELWDRKRARVSDCRACVTELPRRRSFGRGTTAPLGGFTR